MTEHVPTTSRRQLLSAAPAGVMLAGIGTAAAAHAAQPDAELVALCGHFDQLERSYRATDFGGSMGDPGFDRAEAEREAFAQAQDPIVDAICTQPPRTLPGFLAVARSLVLWDAEAISNGGPGGYTNERLLATLLRGMVGGAAA